jgi:hypothetical protein
VDPTPELAARLDADRREAADAMTFEQRALAGVAMFDILADAIRAGIRLQNPHADDTTVEKMLIDRLRTARLHEAKA